MAKKPDEHYNGNKLLSLLDHNGRKPEIYMVAGNRQGGKTFFFKRWMVRRALKYDEPFTLFVRNIKDIPDAGEGFWSDIGPIAFPGKTLKQKPLLSGAAAELWVDGKLIAQVVPLFDPERIKRNSALFAISYRGFLDEFASESRYIPKEIAKFNSIRASIARGGAKGGHSRYFPVYLCSNFVTKYNPYYEAFGVNKQLSKRAKFIRGDGWVLEQNLNEAAARSMREHLRTISGKEMDYMAGNEYLLDNTKYVRKLPGQKTPILNFIHNGKEYGCWWSGDCYYISKTTATGLPASITFSVDDHDHGDIMVDKNDPLVKAFRKQYMQNKVFFQNGACKNAFLDISGLAPK